MDGGAVGGAGLGTLKGMQAKENAMASAGSAGQIIRFLSHN
jgi:hypothetical protein